MQKKIKAKVTERGVLIPRKLLKGIKEVEIRPQTGRIVVVLIPEKDPIFDLGKNPVKSGITDGSINHDKYIYDL